MKAGKKLFAKMGSSEGGEGEGGRGGIAVASRKLPKQKRFQPEKVLPITTQAQSLKFRKYCFIFFVELGLCSASLTAISRFLSFGLPIFTTTTATKSSLLSCSSSPSFSVHCCRRARKKGEKRGGGGAFPICQGSGRA